MVESLANAASPASELSVGTFGVPLTAEATRVVLLGSGELGKELALELHRLGVEVTAVGSYVAGPAMQAAHRGHVVDMLDSDQLLNVLAVERPHIVVPVAGRLEPGILGEIEDGGARVAPSALALQLATDRELLRRVIAEDLGLPTPKYRFAASYAELTEALEQVGLPAVVKPVRSAAGAGHSVVRDRLDAQAAWESAIAGGWFSSDDDADREPRVIVEEFVPFDAELVVFVVRHRATDGSEQLVICPAIQAVEDGGFVAAWCPPQVAPELLARADDLALQAVAALPGLGVFAVELLVTGDQLLVSEVSPRVVSAGFVTMAAWDLSIFALQARAILGLPVSPPRVIAVAAAARGLWATGDGKPLISGIDQALADQPSARVMLYGKPASSGRRAVGMVLATGHDVEAARDAANQAALDIQIGFAEASAG